ncbi:LytTR family DNA-binding domain-containing protein [Sphingomonas sp. LM7]|uniref:LytTR family DNA-binding domain-containing protein n=1 Tax=Sphingomonas sp. LM7 TaxID=1938607 RepID=UPI000983CC24|nr:LytTR family DNA-binding domain-containing protein [Sphingomonas sp. LM7]AQR74956.1 hypothetical protein BXU08_15945 [Sphingomonas sp. LM7]
MRELQGNAIRASRTARPRQSYRRGVLVPTIAAFVMTLTGAFGTDSISLLPRLGYWLVVMGAGALIGILVTAGIRAWGVLSDRPWFEAAAVSLCIALPLTLVVLVGTALFFDRTTASAGYILTLFGMVLAVTSVITAINYTTARAAVPAPEPVAPAEPARPRLAERLPRHLRDAAIHAIEAEDHYLRVHTDLGSDLILMRMSDAIPELVPLEGARTHRSWWVARAAIQSIDRKDGRAELTLPRGVIAPVSRSALPDLRDAGWFEGF